MQEQQLRELERQPQHTQPTQAQAEQQSTQSQMPALNSLLGRQGSKVEEPPPVCPQHSAEPESRQLCASGAHDEQLLSPSPSPSLQQDGALPECDRKQKTQKATRAGQKRRKSLRAEGEKILRDSREILGVCEENTEQLQAEVQGDEGTLSGRLPIAGGQRQAPPSTTKAEDGSRCPESRQREAVVDAPPTKLSGGQEDEAPVRQSCKGSASSTRTSKAGTGPCVPQAPTRESPGLAGNVQSTPQAQEQNVVLQDACESPQVDSSRVTDPRQRQHFYATLRQLASLCYIPSAAVRGLAAPALHQDKQSPNSSSAADGKCTHAIAAEKPDPAGSGSSLQCGLGSHTLRKSLCRSWGPFLSPALCDTGEQSAGKGPEGANCTHMLCTKTGWPKRMEDFLASVAPFSQALSGPQGERLLVLGPCALLHLQESAESTPLQHPQGKQTTAQQTEDPSLIQPVSNEGAAACHVMCGSVASRGYLDAQLCGLGIGSNLAGLCPDLPEGREAGPHQHNRGWVHERQLLEGICPLIRPMRELADAETKDQERLQEAQVEVENLQPRAAKRQQPVHFPACAVVAQLLFGVPLLLAAPVDGKQEELPETPEPQEEDDPLAALTLVQQKEVRWNQKKPFLQQKTEEEENSAAFRPLAYLDVSILGRPVQALVDTGSTHSVISADLCDELQINTVKMGKQVELTLGNGIEMRVDRCVNGLRCQSGPLTFYLSALVGPVAFDLILGMPFLHTERVFWKFNPLGLYVYRSQQHLSLPVSQQVTGGPPGGPPS